MALAQSAGAALTQPVSAAQGAQQNKVLTILYGSQTGNAEYLAKDHKKLLEAEGYPIRIVNMLDYKPMISKESHVLVIVSTIGEGDAPDDALELWEFLGSKKAPLDHLNYAVIALGDSSYEFFCQTGKDFDERLEKLGAKPLKPRLDCDVDYKESADAFIKAITEQVKDELSAGAPVLAAAPVEPAPAVVEYSKANPFLPVYYRRLYYRSRLC